MKIEFEFDLRDQMTFLNKLGYYFKFEERSWSDRKLGDYVAPIWVVYYKDAEFTETRPHDYLLQYSDNAAWITKTFVRELTRKLLKL